MQAIPPRAPSATTRAGRTRPALAATLSALALLTPQAQAQELFGLEAGAAGAPPLQIDRFDSSTCNAFLDCVPIDMTGAAIGGRMIHGITPGGGLAIDESTGERWFTPGPTLHRADPACGNLDQWDVMGAISGGAGVWTGLAIDTGVGKLFFCDHNGIGELDIPPAGSGTGGLLPVSGVDYVSAPGFMAPPLTGVDYDPIDDTLWVVDSQYNLVHMGRPGSGVGVLAWHNVGTLFSGAPQPWCEGVAIDASAFTPGHGRGIVYVVDGLNNRFAVRADGTALGACLVSGPATQLVGLDCLLPEPTTYCTAKVNSQGCTPTIGYSGSPSPASSGFTVTASGMINNKPCILFLGTSGRASIPFYGGFICVAPPIYRSVPLSTGGNPPGDDCSGSPSIDMNCFASGACGGSPPPGLHTPGRVVYCQWWGRDPALAASGGVQLTDALEYTVLP